MADSNLTNLTSASPLSGAETTYIVQNGNSRKTTVQDVSNLATVVRKLVKNQTGATIPKGTPVYQLGSSGTTMTVAPADASTEATAAQTLGVTQEAIADNASGYIVAVGLLDGVNTSALTEGQVVWLSEIAGQLTTTRPTQPAHGVVCGYCVKQSPGTSGILYIKIDNGLELEELHDVLLTGATTGNVLAKFADGLWKPLALNGSDQTTVTTVSTSGTISDSAQTVFINPSENISLTLPSPLSNNGKMIYFKNMANYDITFGSPSGTIDGNTNLVMQFANSSLRLISDGTNWNIF